MLTILTTTDLIDIITNDIHSVERLDELVRITDHHETISDSEKYLKVIAGKIINPLDWNDLEPPFVFPEIDYDRNHLLSFIFYKLENHSRIIDFLDKESAVYRYFIVASKLQLGFEINQEEIEFLKVTDENKTSFAFQLHNHCIVIAYGNTNHSIKYETLKHFFKNALKAHNEPSEKNYTLKHYVQLLIDGGDYTEAEVLLREVLNNTESPKISNEIGNLLANVLMKQLTLPYDLEKINEITILLNACVEYYEATQLLVKAGLTLINSSEIANFKNDFIASKEYINKAIMYFKKLDIPEFLGEAGFRKATLLYTWSKNGSPQYYKPAINAFQDTLKVFKRETHPQKYADIHHNLALIYSEIPVSSEEKPIWTAFCASSFKEVLAYYSRETYPYEYAMVCHNYATALMNFPEAKIHNNLTKAFSFFEEALSVRTAKEYPFERALTLLNQLELYWLLHNENEQVEKQNYNAMIEKAKSISLLTSEADIIIQANNHLEELKKINLN